MLTGQAIRDRLHDESRYVLYPDVAVLEEHDIKDDSGKTIDRVDEEKLKRIAHNNNRLVEHKGTPCPVVIGHTSDKPAKNERRIPEEQEPEVVGYASDFYVGNIKRDDGKDGKAIFCKFHIYKEDAERVEKKYPYRSVELWTGDRWSFHPISVLGATAPEQNLGMLVRHARKYFYSRDLNKSPKPRITLRCDVPLQSSLNTGARKMARNDWSDPYGREEDSDDLTDLPEDQRKMVNLLLKLLQKSPMWDFYKQAAEQEKQEAAAAAMPAPPTPGGPMGAAPGMAATNDPNAAPPPSPPTAGANMAQNQAQESLSPEEAAELQQLLANMGPSQGQSPMTPQQMARNGRPNPLAKPIKKAAPKNLKTACSSTGKSAHMEPDAEEDETVADSVPMKRKPKKRKLYEEPDEPEVYENDQEDEHHNSPGPAVGENGYGQWENTPPGDEGDQDEDGDDGSFAEEGEGDGGFDGLGDEEHGDSDGLMSGPAPDDDNQDSEDQSPIEDGVAGPEYDGDQDHDPDSLPEWQDDDENEPEQHERPGKPKKKGAAMPSPTNTSVPNTGMPRPNERGKPRLDKQGGMPNKKAPGIRTPNANGDVVRKSRTPAPAPKPVGSLAQLQRQIDQLKAVNKELAAQYEALRTRERYSRRESAIKKLVYEGYELDDARAEFEAWKDVPEDIFDKHIASVRKMARQHSDPSRVPMFNMESDNSVLDRQFEATPAIGAELAKIMIKDGCDYEAAVKKYARDPKKYARKS